MQWRRRRERDGLPASWRAILAARSAHWALLDERDRSRLGERADELIRSTRWEAAQGFRMTDEVRTLIAGHAALVALELADDCYAEVGTIVVRSGAMHRREPVPRWGRVDGFVVGSPGPVDGEAHSGDGPVMVNWSAARREAATPRFGRDVVIHEFAHKLDMLDGVVDGTPPLPDDRRQRWIDVFTTAYDAVRAGEADGVLRPYAGTNPGEFFAVAAEAFFTRPVPLAATAPALYDVLRGYFGQDPAARVHRVTGT